MPVTNVSELFSVCHVKQRWTDAWVEVPLLEAITVSDAAAPNHASAVLEHKYGRVSWAADIQSRPRDVGYVTEPFSAFLGYLVRICNVEWCWYGRIMEVVGDREGEVNNFARGTLQYVAYGLSIFLDEMEPIHKSVVTDAREVIGSGLVFNGGLDGRPRNDRPTVYNKGIAGDGLYFADRVRETVEAWTAETALRYLFRYCQPRDEGGNDIIQFGVYSSVGFNSLQYKLQAYESDGKTLWQILNELITRGRGLGFNMLVQNNPTVTAVGPGALSIVEHGSPEVPVVNIWSFSDADYTLPSGVQIKANPDQTSFTLAGVQNITAEVVIDSLMSRYDQVKVIGAFAGSVCTLYPGENIVKGWVQAGVDDFNDARSGDLDYASLTDDEKTERNDHYRSTDKLTNVFSRWFVDGDWDRTQLYDNGVDPEPVPTQVFPELLPNGDLDPDSGVFQWVAALRVQEFVPMFAGVDYEPAITPATNKTVDEDDYLPFPVWFNYRLAEQLDADADSGTPEPRTWTVQTRALKDWPGLKLDVSGGQQRFIADDLYVPNGVYEANVSANRALDHDDWRATVYFLSQNRIQGVYPAVADLADVDSLKVFEVYRPDAHFDYLVPGTTVGVKWTAEDPPVLEYIEAAGGLLRDDREELNDEARLIWEWIRKERRILQLNYVASSQSLPVGTLITTLGGGGQSPVTLNTVVTSVQLNLKTGAVALMTQAAEVDFS